MLTPEFVMNLESNMRQIVENDYAAVAKDLWWSDVARKHPSGSKREIIHWLLSTATLEDQGLGGNIAFDEIEATYMEVTNKFAGKGLKVPRAELEDLDGNGVRGAAKWSSDIAQAFAYWPQIQVSYALNNGHTAALVPTYDGKALFATDHPINPVDRSSGIVFANYFTGAAAGLYPGALPIDESVSAEVALQNLSKLFGYMAGIPQANGRYPRRLRPMAILCPPRLAPRVTLLTDAKFIAMAASTGGGSADVEGLISMLGYGKPIVCDELATPFGGNDTTYYVVFGPLGKLRSQLGAVLYVEREPFSVIYHGPMTSSELARMDVLQWTSRGRNVTAGGHPYEIVKVRST
jgi:phage major head subunit gpT-like protein